MWAIRFEQRAVKELKKLGRVDRERVRSFLDDRLLNLENPRQVGTSLSGEFSGLWRYRVGNIRLICRIEDDKLVVLVISIGNRREVYR